MAEYVFNKNTLLYSSLGFESAERFAEALFEVGSGFLSKSDLPQALKWLGRAHDTVASLPIDHLSREGVELRIAVSQAVVQAQLKTSTPESVTAAESLISCLEHEIGDRPVILLMRLELLQKIPGETFDVDAFVSLLRRMVRAFVSNEGVLNLILYYMKELSHNHYLRAFPVLDEFLLTKLIGTERQSWAEKAVVTRIWMTTSHSDNVQAVTELSKLLGDLVENDLILGPDAAMAGQSVRAQPCAPLGH